MKKNLLSSNSKIPYIFIAFFAVIIAVNIGYIYLAKKTWRGVTTDEAYQKGLNYNDTLKEAEKQKELGWIVDAKVSNGGENEISILISLTDRNSIPINDASINITFKNPVREGYDFTIAPVSSKGTYRFLAKFPVKGQWDAIILVNKGEDKLYVAKRYVIQ
jgi:nitrogen fixation protein FixH